MLGCLRERQIERETAEQRGRRTELKMGTKSDQEMGRMKAKVKEEEMESEWASQLERMWEKEKAQETG
jgi:hypothetical protein